MNVEEIAKMLGRERKKKKQEVEKETRKQER